MFKKLGESAVTHAASWKYRRTLTRNLTIASRLSATMPVVDKSGPTSVPSESTKKQKKPFMKEVFVGKFDAELFAYPEVVHSSSLEEARNNGLKLREGIEKIGEGSSSSIKKKLQFLAKSGIYAKKENQSSLFLFKCESLDLSPDLALSLEIQHSYVIQLISKYGTEEAKEKYLPRLMCGEIVGACAFADRGVCGSDITSMKSIAKLDVDSENNIILKGEKQWVTGAEFADIFVVFALSENVTHVKRPDFSAFIVDRNSSNITLEKINSTVLKNLGAAHVKFNRTHVPQENELRDPTGFLSIADDVMSGCTNFVFACVLGNLKKFISEAVRSVVPKVESTAFLKDSEMVRKTVAKSSTIAYALESMLYFKTGLDDSFVIDTSLESAIIKLFCKDECLKAMEECLSLFGSHAFDNSLPYASLLDDCKGMLASFNTVNVNKLYVGFTGIQYAGKELGETILKNRRPFDFPGFVFKKLMAYRKNEVDNPDLNLQLYLELHQNLQSVANLLEYCILRLNFAVERLLTLHGTEVVNRQLEIGRLAVAASRILAMMSVCSRASRSFCTGIKFSEHEIQHAVTYCIENHQIVKKLINDVIDGALTSNDMNYMRQSSQTITDKCYIFEHPLVKNIE